MDSKGTEIVWSKKDERKAVRGLRPMNRWAEIMMSKSPRKEQSIDMTEYVDDGNGRAVIETTRDQFQTTSSSKIRIVQFNFMMNP